MNDELLSLLDIVAAIRRHVLMIVLSLVVCEGASLLLVKQLPKKFKSTAQLNLKSSYFEIPGVGDGVSYSEVQAQKQALIQSALNEAFLDTEGEKHGLYKSAPGTPARESERDTLRKKIEFISSTATTFRISALGPTAAVAFGLTSDSLDQIVEVLARERRKTIRLHRDSLLKQLESMGITIQTDDGGSGSPAQRQEELRHLEGRLANLHQQYTSNHPTVIALEKKIRALRAQISRDGSGGASAGSDIQAPAPRVKI